MLWHPVKQNSEEPCECCGKTWMQLRRGLVTSSNVAKVMAYHNQPNKFGDPAKRLAADIATVMAGGEMTENPYQSADMARGHINEPLARRRYEQWYPEKYGDFITVEPGGFYADTATGASPDGLVGDGGLIEIKDVINSVHLANIERGKLDPAYRWQIPMLLMQSGRQWVDWVSHCATMPKRRRLFVVRLTRRQLAEDIRAIQKRLEKFWGVVNHYYKLI